MKPALAAVGGWFGRLGAWAADRMEEKSTYLGLALLFASRGKQIPQPVMDALQFWGPFVASGLIAASTKKKAN